VSDLWEYEGEQTEDEKRHRAVWVLVVIACVAVIVVCLAVLFGKGDGPKNAANLGAPDTGSPSTSGFPTASATSASPSDSSTVVPSTPVATGTPRTGNPCPSAGPCIVPGDGGAITAVNAYRAAHAEPPVPGGVSDGAQACALVNGTGTTCVPHYADTALAAQDGTLAVSKIAGFASPWLLDPGISSMSAGWAFVKGQYVCVLLKTS
jgi:hypothetical protein